MQEDAGDFYGFACVYVYVYVCVCIEKSAYLWIRDDGNLGCRLRGRAIDGDAYCCTDNRLLDAINKGVHIWRKNCELLQNGASHCIPISAGDGAAGSRQEQERNIVVDSARVRRDARRSRRSRRTFDAMMDDNMYMHVHTHILRQN